MKPASSPSADAAQSPARRFASIGLTISAGLAGALLFHAIAFPAAWLTGSMLAVSILALAGAPVYLPGAFRGAVFLLLGVSIGSGFTPQVLSDLLKWPLSLASVASRNCRPTSQHAQHGNCETPH
ncbi:MAG: hypothetical protein HC850_14650 [Rhodomicrobium sp.]|nr:hypothetical protein [Rhodomicrobium sp.]